MLADAIPSIASVNLKQLGFSPYYENQFHWTPWLRTVAGIRADICNFDVRTSPVAIPATRRTPSPAQSSASFSALGRKRSYT